jgi:hypothetical protein
MSRRTTTDRQNRQKGNNPMTTSEASSTSTRPKLARYGAAAAVLATAAAVSGLLALPAFSQPLTPSISSITITGYPQPLTPVVVVAGSGFGFAPTWRISPSALADCRPFGHLTGYDFGTSAIWLLDASHSAGLYGAFQEGANFSGANGNCGGVIIETWTPNKVVFTLGSGYQIPGSPGLQSGDSVCVEIKGVPGCSTLP